AAHKQMEAAKRASGKATETLRQSVNSSNPRTIMQSLFACGGANAMDNVNDGEDDEDNGTVARARSTPIQFTDTMDYTLELQQSTSVLTYTDTEETDRETDVTFDDTMVASTTFENVLTKEENRPENYFDIPATKPSLLSLALSRKQENTTVTPEPFMIISAADPDGDIARSRSMKAEQAAKPHQALTSPIIQKMPSLEWENASDNNFDEC
ncbi:MAG: hypothetical protein SGARI_008215, partial [Bacillariaceae sp.]